MKKFESLDRTEQLTVSRLFANWLKCYTTEVINKVMERRDEIINNDMTMNLLRELKTRESDEQIEFESAILWMMEHPDCGNDPHNHCLSHAGSYRDVLYDLYIK